MPRNNRLLVALSEENRDCILSAEVVEKTTADDVINEALEQFFAQKSALFHEMNHSLTKKRKREKNGSSKKPTP